MELAAEIQPLSSGKGEYKIGTLLPSEKAIHLDSLGCRWLLVNSCYQATAPLYF